MLFNNTLIEIWEPTNTTELDPYTKQTKTQYTLKHLIPASFQNDTNSDTQTPHGEIPNTSYKIYITLHKDQINPHSIIRIKDEPQEYSITGTPTWYNHLIPHTKIIISLKQDNIL